MLSTATLAPGGRITTDVVEAEIERLLAAWRPSTEERASRNDITSTVLGATKAAELDRFERVQLDEVLRVCVASRSLSNAGRSLFAESRKRKSSSNDADRLRKYLARYGLAWQDVVDASE